MALQKFEMEASAITELMHHVSLKYPHMSLSLALSCLALGLTFLKANGATRKEMHVTLDSLLNWLEE